jgi:predicted TIM-barrel fold metal-dependent hydrolase
MRNFGKCADSTMRVRKYVMIVQYVAAMILLYGCSPSNPSQVQEVAHSGKSPETMLLKDWQPESIYKIPETNIQKAKYPVIDMHDHDEAKTPEEVAKLVKIMDETGIEKSVIFTNATGSKFDSIYALYSKYPDRFMVYCGFDFSDFPNDGWSDKAIEELRRCVKVGAAGIGELHDKGAGLVPGMHPDDPRMDPLFNACAEMHLPINLHIADPMWMYLPMDSTNDGLMRSWTWRIKDADRVVDHAGLMKILANTLKRHPNNKFVIAHLANCAYDFSILANLFDTYPGFYADISARFSEFSTIPRVANRFFEKYQNRLVYGTDYIWETWDATGDYGNHTTTQQMFRMTFRVLETQDDHFYLTDLVGYKWPMYGIGLTDGALEKIYRTNALKIIGNR